MKRTSLVLLLPLALAMILSLLSSPSAPTLADPPIPRLDHPRFVVVDDTARERAALRAGRAAPPVRLAPAKPRPVVHRVVHRLGTTPAPRPLYPVSVVQRYAYSLLGAARYSCLAHIVAKEDPSWSPTRGNTSGSGAYGIPQALPGSKMASAGADWRTNGETQIRWMISYVRKYGGACGAWAFWQTHHWY